MLMHSLISQMAELQQASQMNRASQSMFAQSRVRRGPFADISPTCHLAQMLHHHSQQVVQSIESRQRQYFQILLSNRDDEMYLDKMIESQITNKKSKSKSSTQRPYDRQLKLQRSELEVVGSDLAQGQQPNLFTSLEQAKLYKLMLTQLANASDDLLRKLLNHLFTSASQAISTQIGRAHV